MYRDQVLPRVIDAVMNRREFAAIRGRVCSGLEGDVLEIGFGSGLNILHYPPAVTRVRADAVSPGRPPARTWHPRPTPRTARAAPRRSSSGRSGSDLGRQFGVTDVVPGRGQDGVNAVRELTSGAGTDRLLECVGLKDALVQSAGVVRDGGTISRVGAPQYPDVPLGFPEFLRNLILTGGVAPPTSKSCCRTSPAARSTRTRL